MKRSQTILAQRLTVSAMLLAMAAVLAAVSAVIPFFHLPFGGNFTLASMLPVILISYMYGIRWGFFSAFVYSLIQILLDLMTGAGGSVIMALFLPASDGFMGYSAAVWILLLDYLAAFTLIGVGGIFRNVFRSKTPALVLGSVVALSLRYLVHVVSGFIFYGAWAEWFFSQDNFYAIGDFFLTRFSGSSLALLYSIFYNGLYMIPEILITAVASVAVARIPVIKKA